MERCTSVWGVFSLRWVLSDIRTKIYFGHKVTWDLNRIKANKIQRMTTFISQ